MAQSIERDWKSKTLELWSSPSLVLEEESTGLLATPQLKEPSPSHPLTDLKIGKPATAAEEEEEPSSEVRGEQATTADVEVIETVEETPPLEPAVAFSTPQTDESPESEPSASEPSTGAALTVEPQEATPQEEPEITVSAEDTVRSREGVEEPPIASGDPAVATPLAAPPAEEDMEETPERPSGWVAPPDHEPRGVDEPLLESAEALGQWDASLASPTATLAEEEDLDEESRDSSSLLTSDVPAPTEPTVEMEVEKGSTDTAGVTKTGSLAESWQEATKEEEPDQEHRQLEDWYSGEVELVLSPPVNFDQVSKLYTHLQNLPDEVRVLHTAGSWDQGTVVTIVIGKPGPLLSQLATIPDLKVTPDPTPEGGLFKTISSMGERSRRRQRIGLSFSDTSEGTEAVDQPDEANTQEEAKEE